MGEKKPSEGLSGGSQEENEANDVYAEYYTEYRFLSRHNIRVLPDVAKFQKYRV